MVQLNESLASIRVGGHVYPLVTAKGCTVCNSSLRWDAENRIVSGSSWANIAGGLPADSGITARHLRDHWKAGHCPPLAESVIEAVEAQAEQRGAAVAEGVAEAATHVVLAEKVVARVNQRLADGEVEPTIRDALRAGEHLARYLPAEAHADEGDYVQAFMVYQETLEGLVDREVFADFGRLLKQNPVLRGLIAKRQALSRSQ